MTLAVVFGLIGFSLNFLDIQILDTAEFKISILLGLFFPLFIALAWGWPGEVSPCGGSGMVMAGASSTRCPSSPSGSSGTGGGQMFDKKADTNIPGTNPRSPWRFPSALSANWDF
jgi:hypothetical protein